MSDNTGDRPEDLPADGVVPAVPPVPPAQPPQPPVQPPASQTPPVAPPASAPPQPGMPQPGMPQPGAGQPGAGQPMPPAYPQQSHPGAAPAYPGRAVPGQPMGGQPAPGQQYAWSFGPGAQPNQTLPTAPISGGSVPPTGTSPTSTKSKIGAGKITGLIVAAAIVGGAAGLGGSFAGANLFDGNGREPAAGPTTVTVNDTSSVNHTTAIATKALPSVVTISATSGSGGGTGSGVILSADGYIVTNTHVVTLDGATGDAAIRVTTSDGRVFDAQVVGLDPTYDLAVIKISGASGLTPMEFADSSMLNVGDSTVAVGAPLGLENTVTTGIVSALNRSIEIASSAAPESSDSEDGTDPQAPDDQQDAPFQFDFGQGQTAPQAKETIKIAVIQTDAAINPGNSGGALVDDDGKLIGINVAIATAGGAGASGSIGVGFSIPSDIVKRITGELIDNGEATHGLLGATVLDAASVEDSTTTGAYIRDVTAGGAAEVGGLQAGDVVTAFNGVPVGDATDITAQVRAAAGGSDATVTFIRDGKSQTIDVTLGTLPV